MDNYKKCRVEGCENKQKYLVKQHCKKHYSQFYRYGRILKRTKYDPNEIIDCGDYYEICLYNVKHKETSRTKIDKEDLDKVKDYKWRLDGRGYVFTSTNTKSIKLHQLIFGKKEGYEIDHINNDPLDNRKRNLRFVTHSQNMMNQNVKGYFWNNKCNKWQAMIKINKKNIYLGRFTNKQDAINARKQGEIKYFKEFAYQGEN